MSNYTGAGKEDKLKFAFMSFDEEGNGVITKAELIKILKANHMASHDAEVARKADTIMAQASGTHDECEILILKMICVMWRFSLI